MRAAAAMLCGATVFATILLSLGGGWRGNSLVQLLPQSQIDAAEQLFSRAGKADKRVEKKVSDCRCPSLPSQLHSLTTQA